MSDLETWLIIILVIGVIASNLAVLKYSAKYKMPQFGKENKPKELNKTSNTTNSTQAPDDNSNKQNGDTTKKAPTQVDSDN
ncbi:DUF2897 family protein [Shewanella sp. UCD-KL12]|uniref:DUF2897 family protein n=1 Tax=Shewanella sp. UCD-KL12 TaxID=1917163 RepID=UPI00097058A9|nr:DUF2897 family protein [Shewanella sp. UCD-KL12]